MQATCGGGSILAIWLCPVPWHAAAYSFSTNEDRAGAATTHRPGPPAQPVRGGKGTAVCALSARTRAPCGHSIAARPCRPAAAPQHPQVAAQCPGQQHRRVGYCDVLTSAPSARTRAPGLVQATQPRHSLLPWLHVALAGAAPPGAVAAVLLDAGLLGCAARARLHPPQPPPPPPPTAGSQPSPGARYARRCAARCAQAPRRAAQARQRLQRRRRCSRAPHALDNALAFDEPGTEPIPRSAGRGCHRRGMLR